MTIKQAVYTHIYNIKLNIMKYIGPARPKRISWKGRSCILEIGTQHKFKAKLMFISYLYKITLITFFINLTISGVYKVSVTIQRYPH